MKVNPADAVALAAVIENDLRAIHGIDAHARTIAGENADRANIESLGFALHNIYNALENTFSQISLTFENHVKDRARWHRELLQKMFLDLSPLRPPLLGDPARSLLNDLLGFRHLFRHSYDFTLDADRVLSLWQRWQTEGGVVLSDISRFRQLLLAESGGWPAPAAGESA